MCVDQNRSREGSCGSELEVSGRIFGDGPGLWLGGLGQVDRGCWLRVGEMQKQRLEGGGVLCVCVSV